MIYMITAWVRADSPRLTVLLRQTVHGPQLVLFFVLGKIPDGLGDKE